MRELGRDLGSGRDRRDPIHHYAGDLDLDRDLRPDRRARRDGAQEEKEEAVAQDAAANDRSTG